MNRNYKLEAMAPWSVALTVVVVGSVVAAWAGIQGYLGDKSFWAWTSGL
ncbi:MAG: hypothetical protein KME29_35045 [Calothrix sp. FI2-JRJ7]|jgi:hypothetical protein|nr:hypothetical protein [Calothrix sp. FI2-JRJ7]